MDKPVSAPFLSRVKSWQLVALGISGWCALYSIAILAGGNGSNLIGHAQGGCFAATMTLAGFESRRYRKSVSLPADSLQWVGGITAEHLNQTLVQLLQKGASKVETCHAAETEMGFGVRAVNAGRTMVFETGRWKEPVINLLHAQTTDENRKKVFADLAIIVSVGTPDEDARNFAKSRPVDFLVGKDLKNLLKAGKPVEKL